MGRREGTWNSIWPRFLPSSFTHHHLSRTPLSRLVCVCICMSTSASLGTLLVLRNHISAFDIFLSWCRFCVNRFLVHLFPSSVVASYSLCPGFAIPSCQDQSHYQSYVRRDENGDAAGVGRYLHGLCDSLHRDPCRGRLRVSLGGGEWTFRAKSSPKSSIAALLGARCGSTARSEPLRCLDPCADSCRGRADIKA